jgi:ribosomal protein L24
MVAERHEIRSAFAHGSIRGWVYLEATMNEHLRKLLSLTPGVNRDRCGLVTQHIPVNEGLKLLTMCSLTDPPTAGEWVQILKGTYKGDVGHVLLTASGRAQLLLVPRLSPPDVSHLKRKRSQPRPPLALFGIEVAFHILPEVDPEKICTVGSNRFEYGLIVKSYGFDSVSSSVSSMSLESFQFFRFSGHPKFITFPRPSEWHFAEGDEVYILPSYADLWALPPKSGTITTLRKDSLEFTTSHGLLRATWSEVCKFIREGDFVEVTGGMHRGRRGWVVDVDLLKGEANIVPIGDDKTDCAEVCSPPTEHPDLVLIFP